MPLFFRSYGDYKSPLYPYLLAGIFRITAHTQPSPGGSAVLGALAVLLLGLLAERITGRTWWPWSSSSSPVSLRGCSSSGALRWRSRRSHCS